MCALPMGIVAGARGTTARAHVRAMGCGRGHAACMRALSTSAITREDDPFFRAGPMPLPPDEQREFERLLREKQGA